jgi:hypothetical protein
MEPICGFRLIHANIDGSHKHCRNNATKIAPDGNYCCGVHIKQYIYKHSKILCDCSICLEPCNLEEDVTHLSCNHYFHTSCIKKWKLQKRNTCPLCRKSIEKSPKINQHLVSQNNFDDLRTTLGDIHSILIQYNSRVNSLYEPISSS